MKEYAVISKDIDDPGTNSVFFGDEEDNQWNTRQEAFDWMADQARTFAESRDVEAHEYKDAFFVEDEDGHEFYWYLVCLPSIP